MTKPIAEIVTMLEDALAKLQRINFKHKDAEVYTKLAVQKLKKAKAQRPTGP